MNLGNFLRDLLILRFHTKENALSYSSRNQLSLELRHTNPSGLTPELLTYTLEAGPIALSVRPNQELSFSQPDANPTPTERLLNCIQHQTTVPSLRPTGFG